MPQKIIKHDSLPKEIIATISQLGDRIRVARKRRGITMEEMSSRMFVNRKTLARLENGDSAVSLAVFASALWVLGLDKDLLRVAQPELDDVGIFHQHRRLPIRVRTTRSSDNLDF
jgi:transcriptional regulator with XRE-family HTH domain